jgi:peptide deformylase
MALLDILRFPDPRLRTQAKSVQQVDERLRQLIDDMFETMYQAPGIGLAATQVNVHKRIIVIDTSQEQNQPLVFINPEILEQDGTEETDEGCLSVPGIYERVQRAEHIRMRALGRDGEAFELEADGLLAVCVQHEIDHLDGKLFVDYLSQLKRRRIRKKLEKQRRHGTEDSDAAEKHAEPVI